MTTFTTPQSRQAKAPTVEAIRLLVRDASVFCVGVHFDRHSCAKQYFFSKMVTICFFVGHHAQL